jgi:hypothetical protein
MKTNNTLEAIRALANHPGYSPVITWDGSGPFVIQADPKLVPVDDGHREILTREQLCHYLDKCAAEATEEELKLAAEWLESEKQQWFEDAE